MDSPVSQQTLTDPLLTGDPASRATDTTRTSEAPPDLAGYEITGRLGEGGMGVVWSAIQLSTNQKVAIKLMGAAGLGSERLKARFAREVELAAGLRHPNIARVYDSGLHRGVYFYAMELIDGVPLDRYAAANRLSRRQIVGLMSRVCRGMEHAHQRGVIHRDLKPSNILVGEDGQPHIVDFGLAKSLLSDSQMEVTVQGAVTGTLAYMSPEQAGGRIDEIGTRSDVYSLGVILYKLLTGQDPHDHSGPLTQVLARISDEDPRPPRRFAKVDRELEAMLGKALARQPQRRYGTAGEMADDLDRYLAGEPLAARRPTVAYVTRKWLRRRRVPLTIALLLMATAISAASYLVNSRSKRLTQAREAVSSGIACEQRGKWAEALGLYRTALSLDHPDPIAVRLRMLRCMEATEDSASLMAEITNLGSRDDLGAHRAEVLVWRGVVGRMGGLQNADDLIRQALQADPPLNAAEAAYARGLIAPTTLTAVGHFQAAIDADPFHAGAWGRLPLCLLMVGRGDEARQKARVAMELLPDDPMPLVILAVDATIRGDEAAANGHIATLRAKGKTNPAGISILEGAMDLVRRTMRQESVMVAAGRLALRVNSELARAGVSLESGADFLGRLPVSTRQAAAHFLRGLVLVNLFKSRALDEFTAAAKLHEDGAIHLLRGCLMLDLGRAQEAEQAFTEALKGGTAFHLYRKNALLGLFLAQMNLAAAEAKSGNPAFSERAAKTLRLVADEGVLPDELAAGSVELAVAFDDLFLARRIWESWRRRQPDSPALLISRAHIEYYSGAYAWAIWYADKAAATAAGDQSVLAAANRVRTLAKDRLARTDLAPLSPRQMMELDRRTFGPGQ